MSVRAPLTKVALFVAVALVWATGQSVRVQDDAAAMIVRSSRRSHRIVRGSTLSRCNKSWSGFVFRG
jgi:hypothetical protein